MKERNVLMGMAMMIAIASLAQGADGERKEIQLSADERTLVTSNNQFTFNLFGKARGSEDMLLSPLSVTYALGMLNNGAIGLTQQEINQVLGFGDAGTDAVNAFCRKMLTEAVGLDPMTNTQIANTIFVNEGLGFYLNTAFEQTANDYYDAQPQSRDFADGKTLEAINKWSSDHTNGMIPQVLKEPEFSSVAANYLLNALYFNGVWTLKFPKDSTREESFNGGAEVPVMHLAAHLGYHETADYQAVCLPYGNEAFRMTVLLPREDRTINDVLGSLDAAQWNAMQLMSTDSVDVKMPRIETTTEMNLRHVLPALGMPTAFNEEQAEIPNVCVNTNLCLGIVKHVAKIKLDEEGTEAAAVTIIGPSGMAGPDIEPTKPQVRIFHATRPFLYIISEQSTNAIFFIGQYVGVDPTRSQNVTAIRQPWQTSQQGTVYTLDGRQVRTPQRGHLYIRDGKKIVAQ